MKLKILRETEKKGPNQAYGNGVELLDHFKITKVGLVIVELAEKIIDQYGHYCHCIILVKDKNLVELLTNKKGKFKYKIIRKDPVFYLEPNYKKINQVLNDLIKTFRVNEIEFHYDF